MTCTLGTVALTFTVSNSERLSGNQPAFGRAVLDQGTVSLTKE